MGRALPRPVIRQPACDATDRRARRSRVKLWRRTAGRDPEAPLSRLFPIATLCRKQCLAPNLYYRWSKEFLEAAKKRLVGDTTREATFTEVRSCATSRATACGHLATDLRTDSVRDESWRPRAGERRRLHLVVRPAFGAGQLHQLRFIDKYIQT